MCSFVIMKDASEFNSPADLPCAGLWVNLASLIISKMPIPLTSKFECNPLLQRCRPFWLTAVLWLVLSLGMKDAGAVLAQSPQPGFVPGSASGPGLGLSGEARFRRQLDSFFWTYSGAFEQTTESFSFELGNVFNSRFYLLRGEPQNIQDENIARLNGAFRVHEQGALLLESRSVRITSTNLRQDWAMAGAAWMPLEGYEIAGLAGFMQDERSGIRDEGLLLGLRASSAPFEAGDFLLQARLHADYGDISPRTFQNWRLGTSSLLDIENFRLEAEIGLARNIRDSYQASSFFNREQTDFIESVRNDTTDVVATAFFPISELIQARVDFSTLLNVRTVRNQALVDGIEDELFDTQINRQLYTIRFEGRYNEGPADIRAGFLYSIGSRQARLLSRGESLASVETERQRTDILINSNFEQQRFELFGTAFLQAGRANTTQLSGRVSIFNYDTPEINRDDRDELFWQLLLSNRHRFSDQFSLSMLLAGEATHTVYLFSERSIENNWRRSLRFAPAVEWAPARWLRTRHQFLVRANYTVDDFQLPGRPNNDQASREFRVQSEAEVRLDREWEASLSVSRSELRIGRLLWSEFREIPTDTLITWDSRAVLTHQSGALRTSVGLRYFVKFDYLPRATVNAETFGPDDAAPVNRSRTAPGRQTTVQWGPVVEMRLPLYARNELYVNGWYQLQSVRQRLYTEYPEEFREAFRAAESRARRTTYPNVEIIARFRF